MCQKKNKPILNQLAVLPWWVTLIIAAIIYPTLRFVLPVISFDNQIISAFTQGVSRIAHLVLVPFIAVAAFSLINQFRKSKMMEEQTGLDSIQNISWRQFEELVGEVFRRQGYLVIENPSAGADGGVDMRLRKNGELTFVQCKYWKSRSVGVKVVRELYGVVTAKKVEKGIIVTFGSFTLDAKEFAQSKPINLIAGNQLVKLISEVQNSSKIATQVDENITCPKCGGEMVLRVAKKAMYSGRKFWGGSHFPGCRGIL